MYPKIEIQIVSDKSEERTYIDRTNNTSRKYVARNISGIVKTDSGAAIVAATAPERLALRTLETGETVTLYFSHFELRKGIWEITIAGLV